MPTIAQEIVVNSNTSVVLLDTQTLPNFNDIVVYLSTANIPGRIVSIRDTTGNLSTTKRIVVSTTSGVSYFNTNYPSSVVINQPYGFITVTTRDPSTWVLQNTFAFPAELSVADVQGVNSKYMLTSTLIVSDVITANTIYSISSVNTNYLSTTDALASGNLYVGTKLNTAPRFQATGSAVLTGNVSVWSTLSTGQDVVVGRSLNVISSFNVGGSTVMFGSVSLLNNVFMASTLVVGGSTVLSNLSTFGPNIGIAADVFMTRNQLNTSDFPTCTRKSNHSACR